MPDEGRFVQQSYYGEADGSKRDGKDWVWNPIQGGGWRGQEAGNPVAEYHQLQLGNRFGSGALGFRQAADRMSDGRKNHTRRRRGPHSLYVPQHRGGRDRPSGYRTGSSGRLRRLCPEEPGILSRGQSVDECRADHGRSGLAERKAYPRRTLGRLRGRLAMGHRRLLARIVVIDRLPLQRRFVRARPAAVPPISRRCGLSPSPKDSSSKTTA